MKHFKSLIIVTLLVCTVAITTFGSREEVTMDQCSMEVTNQCANAAIDAFNQCMGIFGNTAICDIAGHGAACNCTAQHDHCNSVWVCNDN